MADEKVSLRQLELFEKELLDFEYKYCKKEFNAFDVLKIQYMEIRHSNVLSWLLNPSETHGLGDLILRQFFESLLKQYTNLLKKNLIEYDLKSFYTIREQDNIDIHIVSDKEKVVIVIENKIKCGEGMNQLKKYSKVTEVSYKRYEQQYILLSPKPDIQREDEWKVYGYDRLAEILEDVLGNEVINSAEVRSFIQQYVINLRRNVVKDTAILNRINEIYQKHNTAIDLIIGNIPTTKSIIVQMFEKYMVDRKDVILEKFSSKEYKFTTQCVDEMFPKLSTEWESRLLLFEFTIDKNNIKINTVITPSISNRKINVHSILLSVKNDDTLNSIQENIKLEEFNHIHKYHLLKYKIDDFRDDILKEKLCEKLDDYFTDYIPKFEHLLITYKDQLIE